MQTKDDGLPYLERVYVFAAVLSGFCTRNIPVSVRRISCMKSMADDGQIIIGMNYGELSLACWIS